MLHLHPQAEVLNQEHRLEMTGIVEQEVVETSEAARVAPTTSGPQEPKVWAARHQISFIHLTVMVREMGLVNTFDGRRLTQSRLKMSN